MLALLIRLRTILFWYSENDCIQNLENVRSVGKTWLDHDKLETSNYNKQYCIVRHKNTYLMDIDIPGLKLLIKMCTHSSLLKARERLNPLRVSATTGLLYQPQMMADDDYGAVGGMIGRRNRSTRRNPAPVLLYPSQIPRDLNWTRTRAAA
jgi:hypothetical protein